MRRASIQEFESGALEKVILWQFTNCKSRVFARISRVFQYEVICPVNCLSKMDNNNLTLASKFQITWGLSTKQNKPRLSSASVTIKSPKINNNIHIIIKVFHKTERI